MIREAMLLNVVPAVDDGKAAGLSGSPVFDVHGEVIGVQTGVNENARTSFP